MIRILIAAATALLLGALVTEVHSRLFAGQYFALLVLVSAAIFIGSLVTGRAVAIAKPVTTSGQRPRSPAPTAEAGRETGQVKWFNRTKGFGFIVRDNGGEIFVHHRNIRGSGRRSLKDGERVSFTVAPHDKGLQAEQVSVVES